MTMGGKGGVPEPGTYIYIIYICVYLYIAHTQTNAYVQ